MALKRPDAAPDPEQLVFPFQLRVGGVILEDAARLEVVVRPSNAANAKTTRAWVRRDAATLPSEAVWDAWRKLRVIRRAAA